jgi:hypothetical protein
MSTTRADAVRRLENALREQDQAGDRYRTAVGTSDEFAAHVRLRGASDEVNARQSWLDEVDQEPSGGRIWVNGREVGGARSMFSGLEESHD